MVPEPVTGLPAIAKIEGAVKDTLVTVPNAGLGYEMVLSNRQMLGRSSVGMLPPEIWISYLPSGAANPKLPNVSVVMGFRI
jgi:hypothetical protein